MKNPSFVIFEFNSNAIVDFAEDLEEAQGKCKIANSVGSNCKFFETSIYTIEKIRKATKDVDTNHPQQGIVIPGLDMNFRQD
ncbi:hypothetical protein [Nitrosopumilus ureiphilus]|nr:hypothetical protein [Nitrosopumilus ureiphilus]